MNNILYFLITLELLIFANEPNLALLKSVYSNSNQVFNIKQFKFVCKAYGIVSVDELYFEAKEDSSCRRSIDEFYIQNPRARYFSARLLKLNQTYHLEFKGKECILYAKGLNTLSELLLYNGLALKKTSFNDEEFNAVFDEAQVDAKDKNRGMYKNKIKYKCIAELFSIENKNP